MNIELPKTGWPSVLLIAFFAMFTSLAGLWSLPPLDRDEARFAQATVQMLETDNYISINYQTDERNKKPVGIHWLQAASVSLFSTPENREIWAYRLPSILGAILAAITTYFIGLSLFDQRTAFLGACLLASAPLVAAEATIAKTDAVLLSLICLSQLAFISSIRPEQVAERETTLLKRWIWPLVFWVCQAFAILIKGPIAPLISLLTGAGFYFNRGRQIDWFKSLRPVLGLTILVLIITPWAIAIHNTTDGRFFIDAIGGDMLGKIGNAQESHTGPPGYHLLLIWVLFWPGSALFLSGSVVAWRHRQEWQTSFLIAWLVPSWIMFELAATKLPHYVMPLYPAMALLLARAATIKARFPLARKLGAVLFACTGLFAGALIVSLPNFLSASPVSALVIALASIIGLCSLMIATLFWRSQQYKAGLLASLLGAIYAWAVMDVTLPRLNDLGISPAISASLSKNNIHPIKHDNPPVGLAGYHEPSVVFLLGTETVLSTAEAIARDLNNGTLSAAIIERRVSEEFEIERERLGMTVTPLAQITGVNYSNGKRIHLTIFITPQGTMAN